MRKLMSWLGALALAIAACAQDFTQAMTPEERAAAGLHKLTPAELARLKEVVERYKTGEVAVVRRQAERQVAATEAKAQEAERKVAAAEAKAKQVAAPGAAAAPKKTPGWVGALLTLKRAEKAPGNEVLESRLVGELKTFSGRRSFRLENGQVWQMIESDQYAGPTYENPEVFIEPGLFGTFWLRIPDGALRVKVKPIKLE
ncbi:MAG: hypothetical protein C0502_11655 [Opitutus sp.]|nr:hypothetical protein [Opitutus sp.]